MIRCTIPSGHIPEKVYALHILLYEYLGMEYTVQVSGSAKSYTLNCGQGAIRISDAFFGDIKSPLEYIDARHLPHDPRNSSYKELDHCVVIYGEDRYSHEGAEIDVGLDLVSSTFFMLSRWEETLGGERDEHGRFTAKESVAFKHGFLLRPVVNEYAALLKRLLIRLEGDTIQFKKWQYQLVLTCDVDHPFYWRDMRIGVLKALREGFRSRSIARLRQELDIVRQKKDPWDTFGRLMDLAEEKDGTAAFFFMTGGSHPRDPQPYLHDPRLEEVVSQIMNRGHQIGLHPSYTTVEDPAQFNSEVTRFRESWPKAELAGRQHYLRFKVPETWRAWENSGAAWESTMGYADETGFRCGTCWPFPVFDVFSRRMLSVRERPLLLMDATFKYYKKSSAEKAMGEALAIKAQVVKHDGEFVVLWHNSSFYTDTWSDYEIVLTKAFT